MSFTLLGPYSFGAKLPSADFNTLCSFVADALDKSVAGDSIAGTITFTGAGQINANTAGAIIASHTSGISSTIAGGIRTTTLGGIQAQTAKGIQATVADGIAPSVAGGISDGGVAGGIAPTIAGGISDGGVAGGIAATASGGISSNVANGITSNAAGGIAMNGGILDYLQYMQIRSASTFMPPMVHLLASGWSYVANDFPYLIGPGTTATQSIPLLKYYNSLINGCALSTVVMYMNVGASHTGSPSPLPVMNVVRQVLSPGSAPGVPVSLSSTGALSMTNSGGTGASWYSSGQIQTLTFNCNQNNNLGGPGALYTILLTDENTTNALSGNKYWGFYLTFTNIQNDGPVL